MRYRLRTLLILLAILPPLLALGWFVFEKLNRPEPEIVIWESELSLIHGSGQTIEPDDDSKQPE